MTSKEITEIEKLIKTSKQVEDAKHEVLVITQNLFNFGKNIIQYGGFNPNWDNGTYYEGEIKKLRTLNKNLLNWEWKQEATNAKNRMNTIREELKL